jgi:hypothetical protein
MNFLNALESLSSNMRLSFCIEKEFEDNVDKTDKMVNLLMSGFAFEIFFKKYLFTFYNLGILISASIIELQKLSLYLFTVIFCKILVLLFSKFLFLYYSS